MCDWKLGAKETLATHKQLLEEKTRLASTTQADVVFNLLMYTLEN